MPWEMKTVRPGRSRIVHVETELGIVNIYVGLREHRYGRRVEAIEVLPDSGVKKVGRRLIELKDKRRAQR